MLLPGSAAQSGWGHIEVAAQRLAGAVCTIPGCRQSSGSRAPTPRREFGQGLVRLGSLGLCIPHSPGVPECPPLCCQLRTEQMPWSPASFCWLLTPGISILPGWEHASTITLRFPACGRVTLGISRKFCVADVRGISFFRHFLLCPPGTGSEATGLCP